MVGAPRERKTMSDKPEDTETIVSVLLGNAGLSPSAEELSVLEGIYPALKAGIESLYAIPEIRYEAPALVFNPDPVFSDWAS
jgi:hypothetical protein